MTKLESPFSGKVLYQSLYDQFSLFPDFRNQDLIQIPIQDFFMSGFAVFTLKFPSLLKFDQEYRIKNGFSNLSNLFHISRIPSDTQMRTVIDELPNEVFRPIFKSFFNKTQEAKLLSDFEAWQNTYCLAVDGTGFFYSDDVHCDNCMEKKHKSSGEKSYYHQMLVGAIVHPDKRNVIPFCPVPIQKQDGSHKNDSERNAMKRFLNQFREDHPKLKVVLLTDALHSTLPSLDLLQIHRMDYILGVKPGSHEKLFDGLDRRESSGQVYHFEDEEEIGDKVKKKRTKHYRFTNGILLNHQDTKKEVNFIEFWETTQWIDQWGEFKEEKVHMSWITNYSLTESSVRPLVRMARTRWKIENETFNTLKNQGYEFEHNFGHGYKNLSTNFAHLMLLAFFLDQLQEMRCEVFQEALSSVFSKKSRLWEKLKVIYEFFPIQFKNWTDFLRFFIDPTPWLKHIESC